MKNNDFIMTMKRRTRVTAVGPSALRGQGKGVLKATQKYLGIIDLSAIPMTSAAEYANWLNENTNFLLKQLPIINSPWGAARKALNLFMRDVLYNQYLNNSYRISKIEPWLEVPLDRAVAKGLKKHAGRGKLPQWPGLKHLTARISDVFQDFASAYAGQCNIARVHLDVYLWIENR